MHTHAKYLRENFRFSSALLYGQPYQLIATIQCHIPWNSFLPFICKSEWSRIKRISLVATPFVNSNCALRSKNHLAFTPTFCSRFRRVATPMDRRNVACNRWIRSFRRQSKVEKDFNWRGHSFRIFFWEFSSGKLVPDTKTLEKKETKARWHFSSFGNDNYIIHQCHIFLHVAWKFLSTLENCIILPIFLRYSYQDHQHRDQRCR